jgi:hypothetical protein
LVLVVLGSSPFKILFKFQFNPVDIVSIYGQLLLFLVMVAILNKGLDDKFGLNRISGFREED